MLWADPWLQSTRSHSVKGFTAQKLNRFGAPGPRHSKCSEEVVVISCPCPVGSSGSSTRCSGSMSAGLWELYIAAFTSTVPHWVRAGHRVYQASTDAS